MYIYIYREREREMDVCVAVRGLGHTATHGATYAFSVISVQKGAIDVYMHRERESVREILYICIYI